MVRYVPRQHSDTGVLGNKSGCDASCGDCCVLVPVRGAVCHPFSPKLSLSLAENKLPLLRLCMKAPGFGDDFLEHNKVNVLQFGAPPEMLGGDKNNLEMEYSSGSAWLTRGGQSIKVCSATASRPPGGEEAGPGWVDLGAIAQALRCTKDAVTKEWSPLKAEIN